MTKYIDASENAKQMDFIEKIKDYTDAFYAANGRRPLAKTETYGCQQNENDTERINGMLSAAGYEFCDDEREAELVIYNTCAVRENAEDKVYGRLGILKHMKESRPGMTIAVCGCMAQQEHIAERIRRVHPQVDLVFGTHVLYKFPELLWNTISGKKRVYDITLSDGVIFEDMPIKRESSDKAWVSIMYGCNNFCSYCIVPYVRGRERSRKPDKIEAEIKELVASGVSEICLLGQNVNSYGKDLDEDIDFSGLLMRINEIDGIKRIRFMTSHPKDFGDKLIDTMASCEKVCHHLHLPFQAGSDRILKDMNRRYTKEEYLDKIRRLKAKIPDVSLTTDVIVGFPTETNEDFEETLDVIRQVEYDMIFSFIYSQRVGTPAAKLDFVLSKEEIHKNFDRLLEVQNEISKKKNDALVGGVYEVLVEGESKTDSDTLTGRTESSKIVNFKGDKSLIGKYIKVRITEAHTWSLNGEVV